VVAVPRNDVTDGWRLQRTTCEARNSRHTDAAEGDLHEESNQTKFPKGWNEKKVRALAEYYDNQTDEEGAAEIENAEEIPGETWLPVPKELVPAVKKMIALHRKARVKC
jgi:hypothetical protein